MYRKKKKLANKITVLGVQECKEWQFLVWGGSWSLASRSYSAPRLLWDSASLSNIFCYCSGLSDLHHHLSSLRFPENQRVQTTTSEWPPNNQEFALQYLSAVQVSSSFWSIFLTYCRWHILLALNNNKINPTCNLHRPYSPITEISYITSKYSRPIFNGVVQMFFCPCQLSGLTFFSERWNFPSSNASSIASSSKRISNSSLIDFPLRKVYH